MSPATSPKLPLFGLNLESPLPRSVAYDGLGKESNNLMKALANKDYKKASKILDESADADLASSRDAQDQTPLHYAVRDKKTAFIIKLLNDHRVDPSPADKDGITPLHTAAFMGDVNTVNILLEGEADIGARDSQGRNPLQHAAIHGSKEVINLLLRQDPSLAEIKTLSGNTPLHYAVAHGNSDLASSLINSSDLNAVNESGGTPLLLAVKSGSVALVQLLLNSGATVTNNNSSALTPVHLAAFLGKDAIFKLLYYTMKAQLGADDFSNDISITRENGNNLLMDVIEQTPKSKGHAKILEFLREENFVGIETRQVNNDGYNALTLAMMHANSPLVQKLLVSGVPYETNDNSLIPAVCIAAKVKSLDYLKKLQLNGAKLGVTDKDGLNALDYAAIAGANDIIKYFYNNHKLEVGKNADTITSAFSKALFLAAAHGHAQTVELLLGMETNLSYKYKDEQTLLHAAAQSGNVKEYKMLAAKFTAKNIEQNQQDAFGRTPFMVALAHGHKALTTHLFSTSTATPNDNNNNNFLQITAESDNPKTLQLLKKLNLPVDATNNEGQTALHIAVAHGNWQMAKHLLKQGANPDAEDNHGNIPLALLFTKDKFEPEGFKALLSAKTNLNVQVSRNHTILTHLATIGDRESFTLALKHGAKLDHSYPDGRTALDHAIASGNVEVASLLLNFGADINMPHQGRKPLEYLQPNTPNMLAVVKLAYENNADLNILDAFKQSILAKAVKGGNVVLVEYLASLQHIDGHMTRIDPNLGDKSCLAMVQDLAVARTPQERTNIDQVTKALRSMGAKESREFQDIPQLTKELIEQNMPKALAEAAHILGDSLGNLARKWEQEKTADNWSILKRFVVGHVKGWFSVYIEGAGINKLNEADYALVEDFVSKYLLTEDTKVNMIYHFCQEHEGDISTHLYELLEVLDEPTSEYDNLLDYINTHQQELIGKHEF